MKTKSLLMLNACNFLCFYDIPGALVEAHRNIVVLGSGQLARMLAESAQKKGLKTGVLTDAPDDPASLISDSYSNKLENLLEENTICVFENEFIDTAQWTNLKASFVPELSVIELLQDKISQKEILLRLKIPHSPYIVFDNSLNLETNIERAHKKFGDEFILKWAKYGYDGCGTFFYKSQSDKNDVKDFCTRAQEKHSRVFAEKKINFKCERAMIACFSLESEFIHYPLVFSTQEAGICKKMFGRSVAENNQGKQLETSASYFCESLARELQLHGTFAVEFFETEVGELLVNEIAPRVHNTGHYSQLACEYSQFDNHLQAVLGVKLKPVQFKKPFFGMLNLLGPENIEGDFSDMKTPETGDESICCYWYHKKTVKKGRKMGHINFMAETQEDLEKLLKKAVELEVQLWDKVRNYGNS